MNMRSPLFFCICMVTCLSLNGQSSASNEYINHYKEIAISEMHRTGVPASIKLAQALLESSWGQSDLAVYANNHFGIKCGGKWTGEEFYRFDDDVNKQGQPIESCFRKYDSAAESFIAHSDFLSKQKRYQFLFSYPISDYKSWARGLKKAGYATDKHYPVKLIEIIERYELYYYDQSLPGEFVEQQPDDDEIFIDLSAPVDDTEVVVVSHNQDDVVRCKTTRSKKRQSRNKNFHIVVPGETIASIASYYRVKKSAIHLRNRIPKNAEPVVGELIYIKGTLRLNHQPKYTRNKEAIYASANDDFIF